MSNINQFFKYFVKPSLEGEVVEIVKENSQQVVENNSTVSTSEELIIQSPNAIESQLSKESSVKVQSTKVRKKKNKNGVKLKK